VVETGSFRRGVVLGLQNPQHGEYRVPTAGRRRRTQEFVDLPQIADCLHVAAIDSKHKSILQPDNSYSDAYKIVAADDGTYNVPGALAINRPNLNNGDILDTEFGPVTVQDVGSAIIGYHLDVYTGWGPSSCGSWDSGFPYSPFRIISVVPRR